MATERSRLTQDIYSAKLAVAKAELANLTARYEKLLEPAWALSDQIRDAAKRCGTPLEEAGPLLDRTRVTIGGYPLNPRPTVCY